MLKKRLFLACMSLCVSLLLTDSSFAEAYTQWQLPEGVFARLGKGQVSDFVFSPDGSHLAVASSIGIYLYETMTYQVVALITEHAAHLDVIKFSPDGKTIAGAKLHQSDEQSDDQGRFVHFWDAETGRHRHTLPHTPRVGSMVFSPDSTLFATGCSDGSVHFWDAETGRHTQTLSGHTDWVFSVVFSPDGQTLASRSHDMTLRLWDAKSRTRAHTLNHIDHILDFAFSPDSKNIATAIKRRFSSVRFWDVRTGKHTQPLKAYKSVHTSTYAISLLVSCLVFSPDGKTLVTAGDDRIIRFWDTQTGRHTQTLWEHTDYVYSVAFSPDGKTLLCYGGRSLTLWDAKTGALKHVVEHPSRLYSADFSPDSKTMATRGMLDASVHLWDVCRGEHIRTLTGHTRAFYSAIFSPDGKMLATRSDDGKTRLYETQTGRHRHTLTPDGDFRDTTLAFSPDGKTVATGNSAETLRLWDVGTGEHIRTLTGHTEMLHSVMFSPDGKTLTTGSYDGTLRLWDTQTGRHRHTLMLSADPSIFYKVLFSPDGKRFVAGSHDGTLRVWGANTGIHTHTLIGHTERIIEMAFSWESRTLATACGHGMPRLWDVRTGEQIRTLSRDRDAKPPLFHNMAFSPDGKLLAMANRSDTDNAIHFWNVKTGKRTHTFTGHTAEIYSVAFSPDGKLLATAGNDGTVLLWDVPRTLVIYEHPEK